MRRILLSLILLLITVGVASAQTPDGIPPANEDVCDPLFGATPGLFGLCNAYCEAQDCDFEAAHSAQCRAPNPRILINYQRKQQPGDPDMPCIQTVTACPCWTPDEIGAIDNGTDPTSTCTTSGTLVSIAQVFPTSAVATVFGDINDAGATLTCSYFSFDGIDVISRSFEVTPEEAAACSQQIVDQAAAANFTCF